MRRILYLQYTNPGGYPPLAHSALILAQRGWKVRFLGVGADGDADRLQLPFHPHIEERKWNRRGPGPLQKAHYAVFGIWAAWNVLRWRPRWIYASDPLVCPIALALACLPGIRLLYHEHDTRPHDAKKSKTLGERLMAWTRNAVARHARICVLPNEERCGVFRNTTDTPRPVHCVWNCPREDEAAAKPKASHTGPLRLYCHGSLVPCRLPPSVLEAMAAAPHEIELSVVGYETVGSIGYVKQLQAKAERRGIGNRFRYLGALPSRSEILLACGRADVGIALMPMRGGDANESAMTGASNKPFDYMSQGLALLVSDLPAWRRMFVDPGYGLACDPEDPRSIAKALCWFADHPEETRQMGERGRQRILCDWNYQSQFSSLLTMIEESHHAPQESRETVTL